MNSKAQLGGLLGQAVEAGRRGRLHHFVQGPESPAIKLFARAIAAGNLEGDWYGEHAGKWLAAAARAASAATGSADTELADAVRRVADFLCDQQAADGYLGTYAPERRFTIPQPPKAPSWDGAPALRTWDIWTHSYLILGLVEAHRSFGEQRWLDAARRIGDLCLHALTKGGIDITTLGNHHGLSATVLMDPACELYFATGDERYLRLALRVLEQADAHAPLALLSRALAGADAAEIATGKAYQLAWNLVGLAKLHRATGRADLLEAVDRLWASIRAQHLTLGGGPWGGVAHRSREVFNAPGCFSPQAYVETCSTLAWMQLNRELLAITGAARYAAEIERSAYNDLLGAAAENGEDWCYYSFPNGRRVHTTYWRCCKSSGALALEELPAVACQPLAEGWRLNVWGAGRWEAGGWTLTQETAYPADGRIRLRLSGAAPARFALQLRIPDWCATPTLALRTAKPAQAPELVPGRFARIEHEWQDGDEIELDFPMQPRVHVQQLVNDQVSRAPDGSPVVQRVLEHRWLALTRGPLVYATGLVDGYKTEETLRLPAGGVDAPGLVEEIPADDGREPLLRLHPPLRAPITYLPYYRADGRQDGGWRLTWLSLAPPQEEVS
jgi:DUF1680 family protein